MLALYHRYHFLFHHNIIIMAKVIKIGGVRKAPQHKPTTPELNAKEGEFRLLFLRKAGSAVAVGNGHRKLAAWLKENEKDIAAKYRAYRAVPAKGLEEDIEEYKKRVLPFPQYEVSKEQFEIFKNETRTQFHCLWIMLNNSGFPLCQIIPPGYTPSMDIDVNEVIANNSPALKIEDTLHDN